MPLLLDFQDGCFTRTVLIRFIESNLDKTIDTSLSL